MSGVQQLAVRAGEEGLRLDKWFKRRYPDLTHGRFQKLARSGQIRLDGKRVKAGDRVEEGQVVRVPPLGEAQVYKAKTVVPKRPDVPDADADMIQSVVIYRDAAAIAINKPPGLATQGGTGTTRHVDGMLEALGDGDERPRLVHRLDRDTSGVLLLARTRQSAAKLTASFRDRSAKKLYWALVAGVPDPARGKIDLSLRKAGGRGNERMVWDDPSGGDRAITFYATLEKAGKAASLVGLMPQTGRTHQLRAHMAAIGHPVLGDGKYGGEDAQLAGMGLPKGMMLHARALDLPHPTERGRLRVHADLPPAFAAALKTLGFHVGQEADGLLDEDFR